MRILAVLAIVCLASSAFAQTAAPAKPTAKPAAKAGAAPAAAKSAATAKPVTPSVYDAMPASERITLQSDLIAVGVLNGTATGEWGPLSLAAVKAFQKRKGGKETGNLTPEERATLAADAHKKQSEVGWLVVTDISGARIGLPSKLVPQSGKGKSGGHWQSARGEVQIDVFRETAPATLFAVYDVMRKDPIRKVEYNVIRGDFFVLSGLQGLKKFYIRAQAGKGEVRGMTVMYDQAMQGIMEPVVVAMSSAFTAFPATAQATPGAAPKPLVEYATGVIVSTAGDIVTDREAIDGCQVIVANGLGNAEHVAEDKAAGLALVRVYGAPDMKPLPLGSGAPSDVTLVGVADPQTQAGNAAVSVTKAHLGTIGTIDGTLAQGFAGAAAIDAEGGFAGTAVQRPQVV
ncbi:MAG: peptidoglycan-binding protein, partial [Xanthobacteraceae bacterium]